MKVKKMLVVDDKGMLLSLFDRYFTARGWDVDCTREREEAEALILKSDYGVVVTDLCLTSTREFDGLTLLRFIKQRFPRTVVILLTGNGNQEIRRTACELGADAFMSKPQALSSIATAIDDFGRNR